MLKCYRTVCASLDVVVVIAHIYLDRFFYRIFNNLGVPVIMSAHSYSDVYADQAPMRRFLLADSIVLLCESYRDKLPSDLRDRVTIIPNIVPKIVPAARGSLFQKRIINVGRLAAEKQQALLIEAFSRITGAFPEWRLEIWGMGPLENNLRSKIAALGLEGKVFLRGYTEDMDKVYSGASIFCLPSAFEGMSYAMLESLGHGVPYVGFAALPGVNDVIAHGVNGLLALQNTPEALASELEKLMGDEALRQKLAAGAIKSASAYLPEVIWPKWEKLLTDCTAMKGTPLHMSYALDGSDPALEWLFSGKAESEIHKNYFSFMCASKLRNRVRAMH